MCLPGSSLWISVLAPEYAKIVKAKKRLSKHSQEMNATCLEVTWRAGLLPLVQWKRYPVTYRWWPSGRMPRPLFGMSRSNPHNRMTVKYSLKDTEGLTVRPHVPWLLPFCSLLRPSYTCCWCCLRSRKQQHFFICPVKTKKVQQLGRYWSVLVR